MCQVISQNLAKANQTDKTVEVGLDINSTVVTVYGKQEGECPAQPFNSSPDLFQPLQLPHWYWRQYGSHLSLSSAWHSQSF